MGSGYRTFTAGEILTASNVQNFLQDQAVMVFAGTAARSSAIGTANFEEGMLTYLTDVDKLQVYTGATFADVYPAAASTQGLTLINTTSFSAVASQSVNDVFSATYDNYIIVCSLISTADVTVSWRLRVSGADNSTSNYFSHRQQSASSLTTYDAVANAAGSSFQFTSSAGINSNKGVQIMVYKPFATDYTLFNGTHNYSSASGAGQYSGGIIHGGFAATTSFTGFSIIPSSGNITGSVSVFGVNK
jgi:hypothetical protein